MATFKTRRKRLGMTRQQLATEAEIATSTLWRIEEGRVAPSVFVARAIEAALAIKEAESKQEAAS
jgi:DNA-binding XRE family transcriptional regulator